MHAGGDGSVIPLPALARLAEEGTSMDFTFSDAMLDLRDRVRAFVDGRVIPVELEVEAAFDAEVGPGRPFPEVMERLREEARSEDLWNLFLPDAEYGAGLSHHEYGLVCAEMGRSLAAPTAFNCEAPDTGNMEILLEYGTEEQRERWLRPLLEGRARSGFSMTEPDTAGSEPTGLQTRAARDGDDWVISGHKWFTTGAIGAAFLIVMAVTDPDAEPHRRASLLIMPTDAEGFEILRCPPVLGHAGKPGHCEVVYNDVRVPASSMLGERGQGFAVAQARLGPGRIHHCMRAIGHADRAIELMCERARVRQVRNGVLADQQMIQDFIARSRIEADQARLMVLYAAWRMDAFGKKQAAREISMAKVAAAQMAQRVVDRAIQVHGGLGVTDDTPLAGLSRNARTLRLGDGADEVHKIVVARRELAAERSPSASFGQKGALSGR